MRIMRRIFAAIHAYYVVVDCLCVLQGCYNISFSRKESSQFNCGFANLSSIMQHHMIKIKVISPRFSLLSSPPI
uniref:Putative ovule protein n=1 Tax=Solanum chacoense TaxID=4108 RepID=A0A0V0HHG6_SOLCH